MANKGVRAGFSEETQLCFHLRGAANWYKVSICGFTKCAHVTWGFDFLMKTLLVDSVGFVKTQLPHNDLVSKSGGPYLWNLFSNQANTQHCSTR